MIFMPINPTPTIPILTIDVFPLFSSVCVFHQQFPEVQLKPTQLR